MPDSGAGQDTEHASVRSGLPVDPTVPNKTPPGIDAGTTDWWAGLVGGSAGFVGRRGELARFKRALAGDARLLLVVGDAGVGKTRFVTEALRAAAGDGVIAAWGGCLPLAEKLPLLPLAQALGELSRLEDGALLAGALDAAPAYARTEIARLVPGRESRGPGRGDAGGAPGAGAETGGWQRNRLFSAVADVLAAVAARSPVSVVVEDVHWADTTTLDCLTYLLRGRDAAGLTLVATCRGDEAPLDELVVSWLAHVRGSGPVEEIGLAPLSRADVADQIAALAGGPVPDRLADEVFARAQGNPFFTEQLVTAALADVGLDSAAGWADSGPDGVPPGAAGGTGDPSGAVGLHGVPSALPVRLAELLLTRSKRCGPDGQAVLAALSVAGRPLDEPALADVTGRDQAAVRRGLCELAAARLLAGPGSGPVIGSVGALVASEADQARNGGPAGMSWPRHALLAEAVAGALLPGERAVLHERTAATLESTRDEYLAAEAAGHWLAAGRPDRELPARVTAGQAAERVFGYAAAAAHFQRAIALCGDRPDLGNLLAAGAPPGTGPPGSSPPGTHMPGLPELYVRAVDALEIAGDSERAEALAEEAHARFATHPDPAVAARVITRVADFRMRSRPEAALLLLQEAIALVGDGPPSGIQAEVWFRLGRVFIDTGLGDEDGSRAAFERAAEVAAAAGAAALVPRSLLMLAWPASMRGASDEELALLGRARELAEACEDGESLLWIACAESAVHARAGRMEAALQSNLAGLRTARQLGRQDGMEAVMLAANACSDLFDRGRTAEAGALIDPLTSGPSDLQHVYVHLNRIRVDMLRGDLEAAGRRLRKVKAIIAGQAGWFRAQDYAPLVAAELALWTGRPGEALAEVTRELPSLSQPFMYVGGLLLIAGMRACADLAEAARARRDDAAEADALAAAADLVSWVDRLAVTPFTDRPADVYRPAERATWLAERFRLAGDSDQAAWAAAAKTWADIEHTHRAAYACWRQAQALLDAGHPAAAAAPALRAAAKAAQGHAPLLAQVRALAERARIDLSEPSAATVPDSGPAVAREPGRYRLTGRELSVLRLLARGRTNAQIGAELFMSPKTASVHVSSIFRKLGVAGRAQAAAVAERAGLLDSPHP
jgi:DNA-binding CsgD family transcriptional regulator